MFKESKVGDVLIRQRYFNRYERQDKGAETLDNINDWTERVKVVKKGRQYIYVLRESDYDRLNRNERFYMTFDIKSGESRDDVARLFHTMEDVIENKKRKNLLDDILYHIRYMGIGSWEDLSMEDLQTIAKILKISK